MSTETDRQHAHDIRLIRGKPERIQRNVMGQA